MVLESHFLELFDSFQRQICLVTPASMNESERLFPDHNICKKVTERINHLLSTHLGISTRFPGVCQRFSCLRNFNLRSGQVWLLPHQRINFPSFYDFPKFQRLLFEGRTRARCRLERVSRLQANRSPGRPHSVTHLPS